MLTIKKVSDTLGKTFADNLNEKILDSGSIQFTRHEIVNLLGCANLIAASKLNKVLRRLHIDSHKELWKLGPFALARLQSVGMATMYVAMCVLDYHKYDVIEWWSYDENELKFSSFKYKAMRRAKKRQETV